MEQKEDENVTRGKVMVSDSKDSMIFNYTNQMIVGIDLDEVLIINTDDVKFGGSGFINSEIVSSHTNGNHITLRVPPLATIWLQPN